MTSWGFIELEGVSLKRSQIVYRMLLLNMCAFVLLKAELWHVNIGMFLPAEIVILGWNAFDSWWGSVLDSTLDVEVHFTFFPPQNEKCTTASKVYFHLACVTGFERGGGGRKMFPSFILLRFSPSLSSPFLHLPRRLNCTSKNCEVFTEGKIWPHTWFSQCWHVKLYGSHSWSNSLTVIAIRWLLDTALEHKLPWGDTCSKDW